MLHNSIPEFFIEVERCWKSHLSILLRLYPSVASGSIANEIHILITMNHTKCAAVYGSYWNGASNLILYGNFLGYELKVPLTVS